MSEKPVREFDLGDRVQVSRDYFVPELRGLIGRIAEPGELPLNPGSVWVEFEKPATNSGDSEAAEFHPDDLARI